MSAFSVGLRVARVKYQVGQITWAQWHEYLDTIPQMRSTLAEIADLRRRARINKQLAAAVPAETGSFWSRDIAGQWVKRDTPAARRAKQLKRKYRADFTKQLKAARARIPFQPPKVHKGLTIGRPAPVDFSVVREQATERVKRLWSDRQSDDSRATLRYDLGRLRIMRPEVDPHELESPKNRLPEDWRYHSDTFAGPRGYRAYGQYGVNGFAPVRYYDHRWRLLRETTEKTGPVASVAA